MKLSTAQSIPVDIYILILDHLSLRDLASFYTAYALEPKMSQIAKWRCMIRLCNIFTQGCIQAIPIIDGERLYYKQFRDQPFRQIALRGASRATKPFRPFDEKTRLDRIFRGNYLDAWMGLRPSQDQFINTRYQPIDNTGAPGEVVRVDVTFTYAEEVIHLEYDTNGVELHNPFDVEVDPDDATAKRKSLHHRIPLVKATCRHVDDDERRGGYAIPTDWMEFLGSEVRVKVEFVEREVATSGFGLYWRGTASMAAFEMAWRLRLLERCCSADIIGIYRGRGDVCVVIPAHQLDLNSDETEESVEF